MLSVIIATENSERMLVPTLAPLVAGATAALVSEVIVADANSADATAQIADYAGCRIVTSAAPRGERLKQAAALARAQWLLFLRPGEVLQPGWIDDVGRFIENSRLAAEPNQFAATFRRVSPALPGRSPLREAAGLLAEAVGLRRPPLRGLLLHSQFYARLGGHRAEVSDPENEILQRLGKRRVVILRTGAVIL
jgi:hypothetical protein